MLYLKDSYWAVSNTVNKVANNNSCKAYSVNKGMAFATGESLWNVGDYFNCVVQKAVRVSPAV